jgi:transglutaminase-like putative cysteine protease
VHASPGPLLGMIRLLLVASLVVFAYLATRDVFLFNVLAGPLALLVCLRSLRLKTSAEARSLLLLLVLLAASFPLASDSGLVASGAAVLIFLNFACLLRLHTLDFSWSHLLSSLRIVLLALFYALPLMVLLYFIFQNTYLRKISDTGASAVTGLTTHLEPGQVSELVGRSETAYLVKTDPSRLSDEVLFWRVATLTRSKGLEWDRPAPRAGYVVESEKTVPASCRVTQEVTAADDENAVYPLALDRPLEGLPVAKNARVVSTICPQSAEETELDEKTREQLLKLDFQPSERVEALVENWRSRSSSPSEVIQLAKVFLNTGAFHLSLRPERLPRGAAGLDKFLFDSHEGFCEHYAAGLATLLRVAGVPARIVIGFKGGYHNPLGAYWRIAYGDAHAWVEAWDNGRWLRLDPTVGLPALEKSSNLWTDLSGGLVLLVDALAFWARRGATQTKMFWDDLGWRDLLLALVGAIIASFVFAFLRRRTASETQRFEKVFAKLCRKLAKLGLERGSTEGYETFRQRVQDALRQQGKRVSELQRQSIDEAFALYIQIRYARSLPSAEDLQRVQEDLKSFLLAVL